MVSNFFNYPYSGILKGYKSGHLVFVIQSSNVERTLKQYSHLEFDSYELSKNYDLLLDYENYLEIVLSNPSVFAYSETGYELKNLGWSLRKFFYDQNSDLLKLAIHLPIANRIVYIDFHKHIYELFLSDDDLSPKKLNTHSFPKAQIEDLLDKALVLYCNEKYNQAEQKVSRVFSNAV